jgi:hypothetical protein
MSTKARRCARCQADIPSERLEVLPETRLCVACSRAVGGEFDFTVVTENLAKAGSLKKNYGSFSLRKRRRPIEPPPE